MKPVGDIESAIAERRFDNALQGVSALQAAANRAMETGGPEAQALLKQLLIDISRLVMRARSERAHMASDLRAISGSALYQPASAQSSTWRVDA